MSTRPSGHGKPTIQVVDADAASLAVIIEEVQTRYGRDYDVVSGDRSTADPILRASALGHIDCYLPKPVHAPDERFHRTVTELLDEWWRLHGRWFEVVRVVGEEHSARAHEMRDVLHRNGLPVGLYTADSADGQAILREAGAIDVPLPAVILYNGRVLANPSNSEVADAIGVQVRPGRRAYDVAIVGAGPAGLAAGVYAASEGLRVALVEHEALGGQAGTSSLIRNYLGFPRGISGAELAFRAFDQAWLFGAELIYGSSATALTAAGDLRALRLANGSQVMARVVVVASGVSYRRLGAPALEALLGAGVFYGAAVGEAQALAGQPVFVVGGGNSAGQAAIHLARYAERVTIVIRAESLAGSMSDYLIKEIDAAPNIDVRPSTAVVGGGGSGRLAWLDLEDRRTVQVTTVPATAVFVLIGAQPRTDWLDATVARDEAGYVLSAGDVPRQSGEWPAERPPLPFESSLPGVFAIGDVRHGSIKRVASAVGEGSAVVRSIHDYLAIGLKG